ERHAIRIVPGTSALLRPARRAGEGPLVGLGDPIYNRIDDRLPRRVSVPGNARTAGQAMELARLVGSGGEVEECAAIWRSHGDRCILLEGAAASKEKLLDALRQSPR